MSINQNDLAQAVALYEGLKISQPIGQIKESVKYTLQELAKYTDEEVLELIHEFRANGNNA